MNPSKKLTDPDFVYVPAAQTDVQKTWRKFGWQPKTQPTFDQITQEALKILEKEMYEPRSTD